MDVKYIPTTCPYCGTGCGFNLVVKDNKVIGTAPWHRNPINQGKVCPKGNYAHEFVNSPDRLKKPLIKKDGKFQEASWDEAYKLIVSKLKSYKPEEVGFFSSARISNEENYLVAKFARAVVKTPNIDHCARLCHASTVVGLAGAFGSGAMTQSIADIAESKCLLIIGSNTFETHPLEAMTERQSIRTYIPRYANRRRVESSPQSPRGQGTSLRLQAVAADPQSPPDVVDSAPLQIVSPPVPVRRGQLLRVRGWVRVPEQITASHDGLLIYDSLGGSTLGERFAITEGWREFAFSRAAPADEGVTLTFALTGLGEALIDDVSISLHEPIGPQGGLDEARRLPPTGELRR